MYKISRLSLNLKNGGQISELYQNRLIKCRNKNSNDGYSDTTFDVLGRGAKRGGEASWDPLGPGPGGAGVPLSRMRGASSP